MLRSQWIFYESMSVELYITCNQNCFFKRMPVTIFLSHLFFPTDNLTIIVNQFFIVVYMCQKPSMNVQKSKPSNYYNWLLWILWCFILIYEKVARVTNITFNLKIKKWLQRCLLKASKRLDAIFTQELLSRCNLIPAPIKIKGARGNFTINGVRDCETVTTKLWK